MRWLAGRLLWAVLTLFGITLLTFLVVEAGPVDRAEVLVERAAAERTFADAAERERAVAQLRVRYGLVDPATGERRSVWDRYGAWLGDAVQLRFAGPGEDHAALAQRLWQAAPVTAWLGGLALALAFGIGLPLGAWLGLQRGTRRDRVVSTLLLLVAGVPEFLLATLLLLVFGVLLGWLPISGLHSLGAEQWSVGERLLDQARHLLLPVSVMAVGPLVLVVRFVRDSVAHAAASPFVEQMRALGIERRIVLRRLLRHGCVPAATLIGNQLPLLVSGSIVVENLFALDGLGHLVFEAVMAKNQPLLSVLVVIGAVVTLLALILSDLVHRLVDARVRLR